MVVPEYLDDGNLVRRYSNEGYFIRQVETGEIYEDAVDVVPCRYTYEETDEPIEIPEEEPVEILKEAPAENEENNEEGEEHEEDAGE